MLVKPTVSELLKKVEDRYELVVITSKRARQLADGAEPLTDKKETSKVTLAAQEIAEGKVKMINVEEEKEKEREDQEREIAKE